MEELKITDFMSEDLINLSLKSTAKEEVLKELVELLGKSSNIEDKEKCLDALLKREKLGTTGIGKSVAIPHAKTEFAQKLTIAFAISKKGIDFEALDENNTNIFFVFASPVQDSQKYLKILARISRLIRNDNFRNKLLKAETAKEIINIIDEEEQA